MDNALNLRNIYLGNGLTDVAIHKKIGSLCQKYPDACTSLDTNHTFLYQTTLSYVLGQFANIYTHYDKCIKSDSDSEEACDFLYQDLANLRKGIDKLSQLDPKLSKAEMEGFIEFMNMLLE